MKLQKLQSEIIQLRSVAQQNERFSVRRRQVRVFQNKRLNRTYKDLLENKAMSGAARFFLDHLYGVQGVDRRDQQVARVLPKAEQFLPRAALEVLETVLELDLMSEKLDFELSLIIDSVGISSSSLIEDEVYIQAFIKASNRSQREEQLQTLMSAGGGLVKLLRFPMLQGVLKLSRGAAQKANLEDFHQFLQQGVESFKSLKSPSEFLSIIQTRETELLERIYSGRLKHFDEYPSPP